MNRHARLIHSTLLLVSVFSLILASISACALLPPPTPAPLINRDKAIKLAINDCKIPHLALVGEPKNIRTKLLTLQEADKLTRAAGEITYYDIPLDTLVWMVQMDGNLQLYGGPPPSYTQDSQGHVPTPTPRQPFWGTCTAVIDANTGKIIFILG